MSKRASRASSGRVPESGRRRNAPVAAKGPEGAREAFCSITITEDNNELVLPDGHVVKVQPGTYPLHSDDSFSGGKDG